MNNFEYITKICEYETKSKEKQNLRHLKTVLDKIINYIINKKRENPEMTMSDINEEIDDIVQNFLSSTIENNVIRSVMECYLENNMYSGKINVSNLYDKICERERKGEINIDKLDREKIPYSFNVEKSMENLIIVLLKNIRYQQECFDKIEGLNELMQVLKMQSPKVRELTLRKTLNELNYTAEEKENFIKALKDGYKIYFKSERETIEEKIKEHTCESRKKLKEDCIKHITESIKFLNTFGLLEDFTNSNNKSYRKVYINNINYTPEQVKELLSEEKLKKLNIEELMVLSSYWTNRVNKVLQHINMALFIINDKEILKEDKKEKNGIRYVVTEEDVINIILKMNVIHKIYLDIYKQIESTEEYKPVIKLNKHIQEVQRTYGKQYKKYFDRLFPNSENNLKNDIIDSSLYENARYNSYKVKTFNMQALLVCLCNSNSKNIENFGYIEEKDKGKKEILIGVDVKGLNMQYALHMPKHVVLEYLKEAQGNTMFPKYQGSEDFTLREGEMLKSHILVPLTEEADNQIKLATEALTPLDRYANTVRHINYYRKQGKMPEHMMDCIQSKKGKRYVYKRKYVDLAGEGDKELGM